MLCCKLFDLKNFEKIHSHICLNSVYVLLHNDTHRIPLLQTDIKDRSDVGGRLVVMNCIEDGKNLNSGF